MVKSYPQATLLQGRTLQRDFEMVVNAISY